MANIKPLSIWQNGQIETAEQIELHISFDNLQTMATIWYCLQTIDGKRIVEGILNIDGENYQNWDGSNSSALKIVSEILNISYI